MRLLLAGGIVVVLWGVAAGVFWLALTHSLAALVVALIVAFLWCVWAVADAWL